MNYNTNKPEIKGRVQYYAPYVKEPKKRFSWLTACLLAVLVMLVIFSVAWIRAEAEDNNVTMWIMCKPGTSVNYRRTPEKDGIVDGQLKAGDEFRTDGRTANGFVHAVGLGENWDAWIYCGYVVDAKPVEIMENYVCVAKVQAICRKWVDGPPLEKGKLLKNGSCVTVFYIAGDWACTSRGYIQKEWLEVDPV